MDVIRRTMRARRAALDEVAREGAATSVATQLVPLLRTFTVTQALGAYSAVRGELDPAPVVGWAWEQSMAVYLPRVAASRTMVFARFEPDAITHPGAFGVPEPPVGASVCAPSRLDVVLVPLVAFDRAGTRLGTGAGFYDRAFAFRTDQPWGSRPVLVGLAYAFQESPNLERRAWDVPLDYIVTEREVIRASDQALR